MFFLIECIYKLFYYFYRSKVIEYLKNFLGRCVSYFLEELIG